ncbi:MAG: hypothetical protein ABJF11_07965 [Reichenbachiella sp.]|uniref:hypothetical protein n=1 Tax=Reichenbachiella sp. TaxID=2184521 RepID=UPI0032669DA9
MKKIYVVLFILVACSSLGYSQAQKGKTHLGIGLGLNYGGIGGSITHNLSDNFGMFIGLGHQLAGFGYNFGVMYYVPSEKRAQAYFSAMYGTNAALKVEGFTELDKVYLGPTVGFGVKLFGKKNEENYWNFGLLLPFRSSEYDNDVDIVKSLPGIELQEPWPVLFTIGYNINIGG